MIDFTERYFSHHLEVGSKYGRWHWPDFSPAELADSKTQDILIVPRFLCKLQALRWAVAQPLIVTSGYRTPEHNAEVSSTGSKTGPHTKGRAVDIAATGELIYLILRVALPLEFTGIGINSKAGFIHLDDMAKNEGYSRPLVWSY